MPGNKRFFEKHPIHGNHVDLKCNTIILHRSRELTAAVIENPEQLAETVYE